MNITHLTHRCPLRALTIASAERFENHFLESKVTRTLCIWTIHVPKENNSAIVISTISGECRNCAKAVIVLVIALIYFTTVCNVISVLVEMVKFGIVKVDNFSKNKLSAV